YFGARYHGSNVGRWMSPDNGSDQHPQDPQSWNLYSYARNNPEALVDPSGEYVCGASVTQDQCNAFQLQLDTAQAAANEATEKNGNQSEEYQDAQRVIDAYGKQGV